jgi:oleate hydratase
VVNVEANDLVILQNGSMTDASSFGSMSRAPERLTEKDSYSWRLWEKLADVSPEFGNPARFNSSIPETYWLSFNATVRNPAFFDQMEAFTGNRTGTGGLVTFKDSRWLMSIVIHHQPHFEGQPDDVSRCSGAMLSTLIASAISCPSPCRTAVVRRSCESCAVT